MPRGCGLGGDYVTHGDVKSHVDRADIDGCLFRGIIDDETAKLLHGDRLSLESLLDHAEGCCPWADGVPWRLTAMDVRMHRVWHVIMQLSDMHGSLSSKGGISLRSWVGVESYWAHLGQNVSLLAMATQFAGPEVVGALLELRADPNEKVRVGRFSSSLDSGLFGGMLPLSEKSYMDNVSPLHLAAKRASPDMLKRLIAAGANPYARAGNEDDECAVYTTPMQWAAGFANPETLDVFITRGHSLEGKNDGSGSKDDGGEQYPAILTAIHYDNVDNTLHLIKCGARCDRMFQFKYRTDAKESAWMALDVIGCCARSDSGCTLAALIDAGLIGANGIDITTPPIIVAASSGSIQCVHALVRRGAEVDIEIDEADDTVVFRRESLCALEMAVRQNDIGMVATLVECGSGCMQDALDIASITRNDRCVATLIALGARVEDTLRYHIRNNDGDSAHYLAKQSHMDGVDLEVIINAIIEGAGEFTEKARIEIVNNVDLLLRKELTLEWQKNAQLKRTLDTSRDYNLLTQERVQDAYEEVGKQTARIVLLDGELQVTRKELADNKKKLKNAEQNQGVLKKNLDKLAKEAREEKKALNDCEVYWKETTEAYKSTQASNEKIIANLTKELEQAKTPSAERQECAVCFGEVTREMSVGVLPCMHVFCVGCLEGMSDATHILKHDAQCPYQCELPQFGPMRRWTPIFF